MQDANHGHGIISAGADYDAVIVGASLAGCTTAIMLGRAGARVALVEKQPDPRAFKRICSHFIQSSAVPTLERLQLMEPIHAAGGVRTHLRAWTRWGWIAAPHERVPAGLNLRREKLDPLLRETAGATPGVELLLGQTVERLVHEGGAVRGVVASDRAGTATELRARLVIGADGRDSRVAALAGVPEKRTPHGRFAYGGYFDGPPPPWGTDGTIWVLDPQWAAAFPTDDGQVFYAAMGTKDHLPAFKADPEAALRRWVGNVPEAPPILESTLAQPVMGKIDMENRLRRPTAPGLALVGDAALAIDPLWGVGCGFAFQTAEWLADSVTPALLRGDPLEQSLERYRRRYLRGLRGHAQMMVGFAGGRKLNAGERLIFSASVHDERLAIAFDELGSRRVTPERSLARTVPRALVVNARRALRRRQPATAPASAAHEREEVAA